MVVHIVIHFTSNITSTAKKLGIIKIWSFSFLTHLIIKGKWQTWRRWLTLKLRKWFWASIWSFDKRPIRPKISNKASLNMHQCAQKKVHNRIRNEEALHREKPDVLELKNPSIIFHSNFKIYCIMCLKTPDHQKDIATIHVQWTSGNAYV